ncbi:hypothetical protein GCM10010517_19350 [Streptosporangium fragile]|uniref:histidine kinase n=1 Tax=Streptosporangium fragile TaxID=46186 RepID=A0ABP6I9X7_9ACTN
MTTWIQRASRREAAVDLLLWVVLCLPVALAPAIPPWWPSGGYASVWVAVAGALLLGVAVLVSRRTPLGALLAVLAVGSWNVEEGLATTRLWEFGGPVKVGPLNGFTLAMVVLAYLAGRRAVAPRPAVLGFAAILGLGTALTLVSSCGPAPDAATSRFWIPALSGVLLSALLPWTVGRLRRQRVEQRIRERSLITTQALLRERNRIAQDMHDSLGHDLALIALRAAALEMAPDLAERHRAAAGELRAAAADTTERLRQVIGVLREDDPAPLSPPQESVAAIVERAKDSGMRVELRGEGSLRDRTASRVVQEALTNAAKHAPGAPVTVEVLGEPDRIVVTVTSHAPEPPVGRPLRDAPAGRSRRETAAERLRGDTAGGPSGGLGLIGLRERVRLAGGSFESGPRDGGFLVTARFPREDGVR